MGKVKIFEGFVVGQLRALIRLFLKIGLGWDAPLTAIVRNEAYSGCFGLAR